MSSTSGNMSFRRGIRDGLPFVLVVVPLSLVFGVLAVESGLSVAQTIGFSVVVVAGSSQFAALQLMTEDAPLAIVMITALAVNLRMAMYSASLAPHLGAAPWRKRMLLGYLNIDQSFALAITAYEAERGLRLDQKVGYFIGLGVPTVAGWYAGSVAGALMAQSLPATLSLDFAIPAAFLSLVGMMLRTWAHAAAAAVSVAGALALQFLPFNLGLLVAGLAAMATGAAVETWRERGA